MTVLRITQNREQSGQFRVVVALEAEGQARQTATASFDFALTTQEQEDLRWYLEDYLQNPHDPAPKIAARVEKRMAEIGITLFEALFHANNKARDMWANLRTRLNETRVEIVTSVEEAATIPWELIRDPETDEAIALRAKSLVRAQPEARQQPYTPETGSGRIRILLVICRPEGRKDVPFRSVASRIIKSLDEGAVQAFQLDVLRPPTFERLAEVLQEAQAAGKPYHAVHFDGHGAFLNMQRLIEEWKTKTDDEMLKRLADILDIDPNRFSPEIVYPKTPVPGRHGYLLFENPQSEHNFRLVDGEELGKLLVTTNTPVLVLNACRSAYAEAQSAPVSDESGAEDPHEQVEAFGTLAQEVMDAGVTGVVAMRYNVYVVTAAQFVADLYANLARGHSMGEAAALGRKQLHASPLREIAYEPRPLQDWSVPVIYEAAPITLFPKPEHADTLNIEVKPDQAVAGRGEIDPDLPKRPDAGFFGRDETLLALDRAFDTRHVVLLHAYAGSGKTATAAEFARWYALTGGVQGPVLFTSFEQYRPLPRVLDQIGHVFGRALERQGINWLAKNDAQRRDIALQVLEQVPVLWIWDNVEPIAGFPGGTESASSEQEQKELVDFLRDAQVTKAKFLLTSRRDESAWLADLPRRIPIPPMPMQERVQLAKALAEKHGRKLSDVDDWRPLLAFTQGNPLTITVLVGQALRDGLKTKHQIEEFVSKLRAGEAKFEDEAGEGRSRSLGASLSYGFEHAFNEKERKQLALLHFFQGFVNVDVLRVMGAPEADCCLNGLRGLTRDDGIALLDRAAEIGLLTAHGYGCYTIHPVLPWFFKSLFDQYYSLAGDDESPSSKPEPAPSSRNNQQVTAVQAFVNAMGGMGNYYHDEYDRGKRDFIALLKAQEPNLLHARQLARKHGLWRAVISTMQGLGSLYDQTGRAAEWARLVEEILPDFVDLQTHRPLPGREEAWIAVTGYRVDLAIRALRWDEAERIQRAHVKWCRERAAPALGTRAQVLDTSARTGIRNLSVSLHVLAKIQRGQARPECIETDEEAYNLALSIDEGAVAASVALALGHAYKDISGIRNLDRAEEWYRQSLDLLNERDSLGRSNAIGQIGVLYEARLQDAQAVGASEKELLELANQAVQAFRRVLEWAPSDAVETLALSYQHLGNIYALTGHVDQALSAWRESIHHFERGGDDYRAGSARLIVALLLVQISRFPDALDYARAALRNFESYGERTADDVRRTHALIARIEQASKAQGT